MGLKALKETTAKVYGLNCPALESVYQRSMQHLDDLAGKKAADWIVRANGPTAVTYDLDVLGGINAGFMPPFSSDDRKQLLKLAAPGWGLPYNRPERQWEQTQRLIGYASRDALLEHYKLCVEKACGQKIAYRQGFKRAITP